MVLAPRVGEGLLASGFCHLGFALASGCKVIGVEVVVAAFHIFVKLLGFRHREQVAHGLDARIELSDLADLLIDLSLGFRFLGCPFGFFAAAKDLLRLLYGRAFLDRSIQAFRRQPSGLEVLLQLGGVIRLLPAAELLNVADRLARDGVLQAGLGEKVVHFRFGPLLFLLACLLHGRVDGGLLLLTAALCRHFAALLLGLLSCRRSLLRFRFRFRRFLRLGPSLCRFGGLRLSRAFFGRFLRRFCRFGGLRLFRAYAQSVVKLLFGEAHILLLRPFGRWIFPLFHAICAAPRPRGAALTSCRCGGRRPS